MHWWRSFAPELTGPAIAHLNILTAADMLIDFDWLLSSSALQFSQLDLLRVCWFGEILLFVQPDGPTKVADLHSKDPNCSSCFSLVKFAWNQ